MTGIGAGRRILLVEDAAEVRMLVRFVLEDSGFVLDEAADGRSGLAAARGLPDLVLLDVQLPDLDGAAVLRALRDDEVTAVLPIAFLTAEPPSSDAALLGLGAIAVLRKPFNLTTLPDELAALM